MAHWKTEYFKLTGDTRTYEALNEHVGTTEIETIIATQKYTNWQQDIRALQRQVLHEVKAGQWTEQRKAAFIEEKSTPATEPPSNESTRATRVSQRLVLSTESTNRSSQRTRRYCSPAPKRRSSDRRAASVSRHSGDGSSVGVDAVSGTDSPTLPRELPAAAETSAPRMPETRTQIAVAVDEDIRQMVEDAFTAAADVEQLFLTLLRKELQRYEQQQQGQPVSPSTSKQPSTVASPDQDARRTGAIKNILAQCMQQLRAGLQQLNIPPAAD